MRKHLAVNSFIENFAIFAITNTIKHRGLEILLIYEFKSTLALKTDSLQTTKQ